MFFEEEKVEEPHVEEVPAILNPKKFQEENLEAFLKDIETLPWDKPEEAKKEILRLLRAIDRKYFSSFENKISSGLVPELKKQRKKLNLEDEPYFLKKGFVADSAFLTNYQKISKFIKEHENLIQTDSSLKKPDFFASNNQNIHPNAMSQQHFDLHVTTKNIIDTHANSKHFFPLSRNLQFTDFGEMNKEKSNANNYVIQQNWPKLHEFPHQQPLPEHTPEQTLYPGSIIKRNEALEDLIRTEQRMKIAQNDRMKQHIESLGGIEDTVTNMHNVLRNNENLKLERREKGTLQETTFVTERNFEGSGNGKKLKGFIHDPFVKDPIVHNIHLINNFGVTLKDESKEMENPSYFESKMPRNYKQDTTRNREEFNVLKTSKEMRKEKEFLLERGFLQKHNG